MTRPWVSWPLLWLTATGGVVLLAVSYSMAATRGVDQGHYAVFWAGMLVFTVPAIAVACSKRATDRVRLGWLAAYALFTYVPKLLRNPSGPLYHDEIAHWRQTVGIATTGHLFEPNATIGIISRFPGLHIVVATISKATGLSVWQAALVVLVLAHVLTVLGTVVLGESLFGSVRAGMVVALVYSLNSSFLYFDTQFAYESLAVPLFVWCIAALAKAHNATERGERLGWTVTASVIGALTVTVHHLTALILVLVLAIVTVATVAGARRGRTPWPVARGTATVLAVTGGVAATWIVTVAPETISYLSPYLGGGLSQLFHLFAGSGSGRTLFSASTEPGYERILAFAAPVAIGVLALIVVVPPLWRHRKREQRSPTRATLTTTDEQQSAANEQQSPTPLAADEQRSPTGATLSSTGEAPRPAAKARWLARRAVRLATGEQHQPTTPAARERGPLWRAVLSVTGEQWSPLRAGLSGFGLLYFPSVLFILIQSGAEGARRSWAFSYLGLAVLVAPAALAIWDRVRWRQLWRTITTYVTAFALWATMLVGNVAAGLDESYRFPGPYVFGSDTRSLTPELLAAAAWFEQHVGSGVRIVTDRFTGLGFVLDADSWTASPSAGFPAYDLFFSANPPSAELVEELASSDYEYLIIDKRVTTAIPAIGSYFEPDEQFADLDSHPMAAANIDSLRDPTVDHQGVRERPLRDLPLRLQRDPRPGDAVIILLRRMALPVALVAAAALAYAFVPGGIVRAVLVLPATLWVPGRGLVALFGIGTGAGRWRTPLSVLLSLLTLIVAALLANALGGSVPVAALPLVASVVLLPAHLVGDAPTEQPVVSNGALVRFGAVFGVAACAAAAVLWFVSGALPKQQAAPYLEFALAGPYARVSGTVPVTTGQQLHVPVTVTGDESSALTIQAVLNGSPIGNPVPVHSTTQGGSTPQGASTAQVDGTGQVDNARRVDGTAQVDVTAPAGCLSRLSIVLSSGATELRSVDLYLRSTSDPACARQN